MDKKKLQNTLLLFSLFILLVLPTAIVGYGNLSTLVNRAFGKPFQKDESTFIVSTESSTNITKGGQFSLKSTATTPKALPFKYFAALIEFDSNSVDIRSINLQNEDDFVVVAYQNGFLVHPKTMATPTKYEEILPSTCFDNATCDLTKVSVSSVSFTINGILINQLSPQQRPIKVTFIGASETDSVFLWNETDVLPELKLGDYIKNEIPTFTSEPTNYAHEGTTYEYAITTTDADQDPVTLSLKCPEQVFCDKKATTPENVRIEGSKLVWDAPVAQDDPYKITVFANDGKSISTQSFLLYVLSKDVAYFTCTYTPAIAVRIIDYREITPLVIVAESSEPLVKAVATLERDSVVEKSFEYTFANPSKKVLLDQNSTPPLAYQFKKGVYSGKATFTSISGQEFTCILDNPTEKLTTLIQKAFAQTVKDFVSPVFALVADINNAPVFTNDPYLPASSGGSVPGVSFVYGNGYTFTLQAQDYDGDVLSHTIVAKPAWAQVAVSKSAGETSTIQIQFTGTPTAAHAGSNLFAITVNDGYGHYITKTWVINVDYPDNDIPRVTLTRTNQFTLPANCPPQTNTPVTLHQGSGFMLVFDAEDRHQIVKFGLYFAKSLNATTWSTYNANISYKMRCMEVNTANIPPGDYYFKLTATDGFTPPATGVAYTGLVRILPPKPKPTATPKPTAVPTTPIPTGTGSVTPSVTVTPTATPTSTPTPTPTEDIPQPDEVLINITSPLDQKKIAGKDFQIVASVRSSKDGEVEKKNIFIFLDNKDISEKMEYSGDKAKSITLTYKPTTLIEPGVHEIKIEATDSKSKTASTTISFIVEEPQPSSEDLVNFLGFEIEKKWYALLIAAIILLGILILLPIILYFASRNNERFEPAVKPAYKPTLPPSPPNLRSPTSSFATPQAQSVAPPTQQATMTPYKPTLNVPQRPLAPQMSQSPMGPSSQTQMPQVAPVSVSPSVQPKPVVVPVTPPITTPPVAPVVAAPVPQKPTDVPTSPSLKMNQEQAMANFISQATQPGGKMPLRPEQAEKPKESIQSKLVQEQPVAPKTPSPAAMKPTPAQPPIQTSKTQAQTPPPSVPGKQQPTPQPKINAPNSTPVTVPSSVKTDLPPESPTIPLK